MQLVMGNEAIALGAIQAGVHVVAGYPGTPSTEILETIAKNNIDHSIYVEWSVNEKVGMEVAAGASYAGARSLVTMKQVGLNVASDPLMSLVYVGVKGGMVIIVADDPGPISSQTEQDTRRFALFAKIPVFDPASPEEAYQMVQDAFVLSEKYGTPVIVRPTTRVCHGCTSMQIPPARKPLPIAGFIKDTKKWVIFPRASYLNHLKLEKRNSGELNDYFSSSSYNMVLSHESSSAQTIRRGIITGGVSYEYTQEALQIISGESKDFQYSLLKIGTPFPFPEKKVLSFLRSVDEIIVIEELDPVIEDSVIFLCGKEHLNNTIHGKHDGCVQCAGENTVENVREVLLKYLSGDTVCNTISETNLPPLPVRPPVLCAGCPHRGSFYTVKRTVKKYFSDKKVVYSGDIGCYTLGNAAPLDMCDTCLCMGADVTIAQGLHRAEPDSINFSFIGDSTFFASGIPGVINAVYNQTPIVLCILDNSTTAMTGQQPHPGTGITMMGNVVPKVSIEKILEAIGVKSIETIDPFNLSSSIEAVKNAIDTSIGDHCVSAVIFKAPCISIVPKLLKTGELSKDSVSGNNKFFVDTMKCRFCRKCITELGCPAIVVSSGESGKQKAFIESSLCTGCSLCSQVCPFNAISSTRGKK